MDILAIIAGLALLVWSAARFVDGASAAARHFGMPPLLIGIIIVGFGTSAPELAVSLFGALQGNSGIAIGNAYGSNITNIALILGTTAVIRPVLVQSGILRKELPFLLGVTLLSALLVADGRISRMDSALLLAVFAGLVGWSLYQGMRPTRDTLAEDVRHNLGISDSADGGGTDATDAAPERTPTGLRTALVNVVLGLTLLVVSSRLLVWGAVSVAAGLGISDLVVGLTVVAVGTSLPELASSIIASRRGESDLAFGNILGSNLFNTLAVIGGAGVISPMAAGPEVLSRDMLVLTLLTASLFLLGYGFRGGQGRINRYEGGLLLVAYVVYTGYLVGAA